MRLPPPPMCSPKKHFFGSLGLGGSVGGVGGWVIPPPRLSQHSVSTWLRMLKSSYVPHTRLTVLTVWSSSSSFPAKRQEIDGAWYWVGKYWGFFNSSVKRVPLLVNFLISVAGGEMSFLHRFSQQTF